MKHDTSKAYEVQTRPSAFKLDYVQHNYKVCQNCVSEKHSSEISIW